MDQPVIGSRDRIGEAGKPGLQRLGILQPAQPGDGTAIGDQARDGVGLFIAAHLQPVLQRAQRAVTGSQPLRLGRRHMAGCGQRGEAIQRCRAAQRRITPAPDQLVDLGKKLHLANAAAPAFQIKAGADSLAALEMVADAQRHRLDIAHRSVIQAAPPHEGPDAGEEIAAHRDITAHGAGTDESDAFPGQRFGLIIMFRRRQADRHRRDFAGRAQPQIDAGDIAIRGKITQDGDGAARDAHGSLAGILTAPPRDQIRIVHENQIGIGAVVELAAAQLAQRQRRKPARRRAAFGQRGGDGGIDGQIGEVRQRRCHLLQPPQPGQIGQRHHQRHIAPGGAQARHDRLRGIGRQGQRLRQGGFRPGGGEQRQCCRPAANQALEERCIGAGGNGGFGEGR